MVEKILKVGKAQVVIDVRSPEEFRSGNAKGSVNIPLGKIAASLDEIREIEGPIVLCCASGNRSGVAINLLKQCGINNVENGGSWSEVQAKSII